MNRTLPEDAPKLVVQSAIRYRRTMDLERIRDDFLLELPPSGWSGFEGLLATALASVIGAKVHLAKAGSQSGLDGRSEPEPSISFEAKRYGAGRALSDRELLGELEELSQATSTAPEVWMLAATVPVAVQTRTKLNRAARARGIHVALVDWTPAKSPSLLVFLAAARNEIAGWIDHHHPNCPLRDELLQVLETVYRGRGFKRKLQSIRRNLVPASASYVTAKMSTDTAYQLAFRDRGEAKRIFGQQISPDASKTATVIRTDLLQDIREACREAVRRRGVTVLLGEEGTGKTWAAIDTWRKYFSNSMLVFLSSGHIEMFRGGTATHAVAHAIRAAVKGYEVDTKGWEARVRNWTQIRDNRRKLFVVIDGVNERPGVNWLSFIPDIHQLVAAVGGVTLLTSRPRFWQTRISPAFMGEMEILNVGGFNDREIKEFLTAHRRDSDQIPNNLWEQIRNPRVLTVAVNLLDELGGNDLTRDRLLWCYWKHYWRERSDTAVTDEEFREMLAEHARRMIEAQQDANVANRFLFSRWADYGAIGAMSRGQTLADTFWNVLDGRFLVPASVGARESYSFRPDVISFAIALRLIYDILDQTSPSGGDEKIGEKLANALEPIAAFDQTSEIVISSLAISCLHERSYIALQRSVVRAILNLQNFDDRFAGDFCAYIRDAPMAYIDVANELVIAGASPPNLLKKALQAGMSRPEVTPYLMTAFAQWRDQDPLLAEQWIAEISEPMH